MVLTIRDLSRPVVDDCEAYDLLLAALDEAPNAASASFLRARLGECFAYRRAFSLTLVAGGAEPLLAEAA